MAEGYSVAPSAPPSYNEIMNGSEDPLPSTPCYMEFGTQPPDHLNSPYAASYAESLPEYTPQIVTCFDKNQDAIPTAPAYSHASPRANYGTCFDNGRFDHPGIYPSFTEESWTHSHASALRLISDERRSRINVEPDPVRSSFVSASSGSQQRGPNEERCRGARRIAQNPPSNMGLACSACLLFCPLGFIAFICAALSRRSSERRDFETARRHGRTAMALSLVSLFFCAIILAILFYLVMSGQPR